jgi:hypothetical protein
MALESEQTVMMDQSNHANNAHVNPFMPDRETYLFSLLDTPVTAEPSALFTPLAVFGLGLALAGLKYDRPSLLARLRFGLLTLIAYYIADIFHIGGHIFSARSAGAPVDRVHLAIPLARTFYDNNHVAPRTHCRRAIGGPIGSGIGLIIAWLLSRLTPGRSVWRDLFNMMSLANGLTCFGSFYPLPYIDGGTLLKWTLVQKGATPDEADRLVQQTNLALGAASTIGLVLTGRRIVKATATFLKGEIYRQITYPS